MIHSERATPELTRRRAITLFAYCGCTLGIHCVSVAGISAVHAQSESVSWSIVAAGCHILVSVDDATLRARHSAVDRWVLRAASAVAAYYGAFPARRLSIRISAVDGGRVRSGVLRLAHELVIDVTLGRSVTAAELDDDWILVHEMVHLALPRLADAHHWLSEGLATYVEGVARAQAGTRTVEDVWSEWLERMPLGRPQVGGGGLDDSRSWARTYWGGALFCLMADVRLRQQSQNRSGLQDAMRAILALGGGYRESASLPALLAEAGRSMGNDVLTQLYEEIGQHEGSTAIEAMWQQLGVDRTDGELRIDETAPLAALRRAITAHRQ